MRSEKVTARVAQSAFDATENSAILGGFDPSAPAKTSLTNFASTCANFISSVPAPDPPAFAGAVATVFQCSPSEEISTEYGKGSELPRATVIFPTWAGLPKFTVSVARASAATQAVAGMPSTAATAGDPRSEELALIGRQRAKLSVG
jgi:hypothetical protein